MATGLVGLGFAGYKFIDRKHEENREILNEMSKTLASLSTDLKHLDNEISTLRGTISRLQDDHIEIWRYLAGFKRNP